MELLTGARSSWLWPNNPRKSSPSHTRAARCMLHQCRVTRHCALLPATRFLVSPFVTGFQQFHSDFLFSSFPLSLYSSQFYPASSRSIRFPFAARSDTLFELWAGFESLSSDSFPVYAQFRPSDPPHSTLFSLVFLSPVRTQLVGQVGNCNKVTGRPPRIHNFSSLRSRFYSTFSVDLFSIYLINFCRTIHKLYLTHLIFDNK